jgi:hypothetical protein
LALDIRNPENPLSMNIKYIEEFENTRVLLLSDTIYSVARTWLMLKTNTKNKLILKLTSAQLLLFYLVGKSIRLC